MKQSRASHMLLASCVLVAFLLAGCTGGSVPSTAMSEASAQEGHLRIVSPLEDTRLSGGGDLRIALSLVDQDDLPIEGAAVQAELWHPGGELFAEIPCEDRGSGSYLAETVSLPLRGSSGTWRIMVRATLPNGQPAEAESAIRAGPSISEIYLERHGFWVEYPQIFGLGTGFYNLQETGGLHFEDWLNGDGSGYVILDNYRYVAIGVTFATLEVHWQDLDFPEDEADAAAFAASLDGAGFHHQDPDTPLKEMAAEAFTFHGRPAWHVSGLGSEYYVSSAGAEYPVEWLILQCPGSDWLWALVIAADDANYMDHLRTVRNTFKCPLANRN
jgi:hypothetical protein